LDSPLAVKTLLFRLEALFYRYSASFGVYTAKVIYAISILWIFTIFLLSGAGKLEFKSKQERSLTSPCFPFLG
jgi:hypothetical protein